MLLVIYILHCYDITGCFRRCYKYTRAYHGSCLHKYTFLLPYFVGIWLRGEPTNERSARCSCLFPAVCGEEFILAVKCTASTVQLYCRKKKENSFKGSWPAVISNCMQVSPNKEAIEVT